MTAVLHHAPSGLTPAERLVLVAIAEYVHQDDYKRGSRQTARTHAELASVAGLSDAALRKAIYRLANPGAEHADRPPLEVRVPLGRSQAGNVVWAVDGRKPIFRVPALTAPFGCACALCTNPKVGQESEQEIGQESEQEAKVGQQSEEGRTPVPPYRSVTEVAKEAAARDDETAADDHDLAAAAIVAAVGCSLADARTFVDRTVADRARRGNPIGNIPKYFTAVAARDPESLRHQLLGKPGRSSKPKPAPPAPVGDVCGECDGRADDPPHMRLIHYDDGRSPTLCPRCNPKVPQAVNCA